MAILTATRTIVVVLAVASVGCAGAPSQSATSEELLALYLDDTRGMAPLHAKLVYGQRSTCTVPPWNAVHPEETALTWPTFWRAELAEVIDAHPLLSLDETVIVAREPDLKSGVETDVASVLSATTWAGNPNVVCDDESIDGETIVLAGFFHPMPVDEVFARASEQADRLGLNPVGDLDVAIEPSQQIPPE